MSQQVQLGRVHFGCVALLVQDRRQLLNMLKLIESLFSKYSSRYGGWTTAKIQRTSPRSNIYTYTVPPIGSPIPQKSGPPQKSGATLCFHLGIPFRSPKMGHLRYLERPGAMHLEIGHIPCQEIHNAFAKDLRDLGWAGWAVAFQHARNIVCKEHLQNLATVPDPKSFGASFGTANISPVYCSILQYWRIGPFWADSTRFEG